MLDKLLVKSNETLMYINDLNGQKRWLFPGKLNRATFLNLYNTNTIKGKIYKVVMHIAFFLRLQKYFVSGSIDYSLNQDLSLLLDKLKIVSFSIFTGTPGNNRKIVIELNDGKQTLWFMKIPVSKSSKELVEQENKILNILSKHVFQYIIIPKVYLFDGEKLIISNIKPTEKVISTTKFLIQHENALKELFLLKMQKKTLRDTQYFTNSKIVFAELEEQLLIHQDHDLFYQIKNIKLYSDVLYNILIKKEIVCSLAHGDFTPWNIFITPEKLYIYDWELAQDQMPLFFDFFHYIFQSEVLINHRDYSSLKEIIAINIDLYFKDIIDKYMIDINIYYNLYLIYNSSYYSLKYFKQDKLHEQGYWLLDIWESALKESSVKKGKIFEL